MDLKAIAIAAVLGGIGGAGGAYMLTSNLEKKVDDRFSQSPPLVVVDFTKIAMSYGEGMTPEELENVMVKTNDAVFKLKEAGYLVLDAAAVVNGPKDLYLEEGLIE